MRFDGNVDYWSPEEEKKSGIFGVAIIPSGAGAKRKYILGTTQIVRIIPAADMFIYFLTTDTTIVDATSIHIQLKANEEYFISSGNNKFMIASVNTANVIPILQKGTVARNAKPA